MLKDLMYLFTYLLTVRRHVL